MHDLRRSHGYSIDWVPRLSLKISGRLEGYILDIDIAKNMKSRPWNLFYITKARDPQGLSDPWKNMFTYFHSQMTVWTQNPFQVIVKEQKLSVFLYFSLFDKQIFHSAIKPVLRPSRNEMRNKKYEKDIFSAV